MKYFSINDARVFSFFFFFKYRFCNSAAVLDKFDIKNNFWNIFDRIENSRRIIINGIKSFLFHFFFFPLLFDSSWLTKFSKNFPMSKNKIISQNVSNRYLFIWILKRIIWIRIARMRRDWKRVTLIGYKCKGKERISLMSRSEWHIVCCPLVRPSANRFHPLLLLHPFTLFYSLT